MRVTTGDGASEMAARASICSCSRRESMEGGISMNRDKTAVPDNGVGVSPHFFRQHTLEKSEGRQLIACTGQAGGRLWICVEATRGELSPTPRALVSDLFGFDLFPGGRRRVHW